jgi:threonine dehydrogenase-like Zn-dependent dehydrogenase
VVLEAVGTMPAYEQAVGIVRPGGIISRVGVPQYEEAPTGMESLFRQNLRLAGGPAPVRAYIEELMPDILNGTIEPGKVFDVTTNLDGVPAGYQDMADRKSLKVLIRKSTVSRHAGSVRGEPGSDQGALGGPVMAGQAAGSRVTL